MAKIMFNSQRKLNKNLLGIIIFVMVALTMCSFVLISKSTFSKGTGSNNQNIVTTPSITTNIDIDMKENIIALCVGEKYQLGYEGVTYSTNACTIAYVDENGLIEGISEGTTSVVLKKDGKICGSVAVIVNKEMPTSVCEEDRFGSLSKKESEDMIIEKDDLTEKLQSITEEKVVKYRLQKNITSESLYQLQKKEIKLILQGNDYELIIDGKDIEDHSEALNTQIDVYPVKNGYAFRMKTKKNLPGKIYINFTSNKYKTKYIYGFNERLKRYDLISNNSSYGVLLDQGEKYMLTNNELYKFKIDYKYIVVLVSIVVAFLIIYILVKKRYWFW